jgi:hypothetical protein
VSHGNNAGRIASESIDKAVRIALQKHKAVDIIAQREHRRIATDRFDGLIESSLKALGGLGASVEIPSQGLLVFRSASGWSVTSAIRTSFQSLSDPLSDNGPGTCVSRASLDLTGAPSDLAQPSRIERKSIHLIFRG